MRILVLGGAGFMGSNYVRYILFNYPEIEVGVYDKLSYAGRLENLHDLGREIRFVKGDVADENLLKKVIKEFDPNVVVNFAAETHVDRSINEPSPFIKTNILGVFNVLETLRASAGDPLYVHISTDEVYGDLVGTEEFADETWPLNPSSPYSASKASGDLLIKSYGRTYGLKYKIVRPCNNYGPYQHPEKLIPRTIIRLLLGKPATIYGDGSQVRDWLHVRDFVNGLDVIVQRGEINGIYNICGNYFASVKEIVTRIATIMGRDPSKDIIYVKGRPGEDRRYAMRCDKLFELGWRPKIDLNKGLKDTVNWYLDNEWWWKPVIRDKYVLSEEPWRQTEQ